MKGSSFNTGPSSEHHNWLVGGPGLVDVGEVGLVTVKGAAKVTGCTGTAVQLYSTSVIVQMLEERDGGAWTAQEVLALGAALKHRVECPP